MKHRSRTKHRTLKLVAIPAIVGASLAGGFAAAAFTGSGSFEADGTVATPTSPTATAHIASLWPGECSDVSVTFTNDNDHSVVLDSISGTITRQPSVDDPGSDTGSDTGHGPGSGSGRGAAYGPGYGSSYGNGSGRSDDLVVWRGAADALAGQEISADATQTFTIPGAVCLSAKAGTEVEGADVAASVTFGFHVPVGTAYTG